MNQENQNAERIARGDGQSATLNEPTPVTVSFVEYEAPVGKAFGYKDGEWGKKPLTRSPVAKAITLAFPDFSAFAAFRSAAGPKLMQVSGTFALTDHGKPCRYARDVGEGDVAATRHFLTYRPSQPGVVKLDSDVKSADEVAALFPEAPQTWSTPEDFLAAIEEAIPELAACPALVMDSTSARIHHQGVMRKSGDGGFHTDIPVDDARDTPAILERLHYRLVAAGLGWAFVDTGGTIQVRSPVDLAIKTVTQPAFCAPLLGPGVEQDRRTLLRPDGQYLRLTDIEWSADQRAACVANIAALKAPLQAASNQIKTERNTKIAKSLLGREDVTKKEVVAVCNTLAAGNLLPTMLVTFTNPDETVLLSELLLNGERFHERDCLDPLRPEYDGGRPIAKFYWNDGLPMIHSFASGSHALRLVWTMASYPKPEGVNAAINALGRVVYKTEAEFDALVKSEAKRLGTSATLLRDGFRAANERAAADFANEEDELASAKLDFGDFPPPAAKETKQAGQFSADERLPLGLFHPSRLLVTDQEVRPMGHVANVATLLDAYGIDVRYNVISKVMNSSSLNDDSDNGQEGFYANVLGLANMNRFLTDNFGTFFSGVLDQRPYNPVTDYLQELVWDGIPRIEAFANGVSRDATSEIAHRLFLIGACAAADGGERGCAANPAARKTYEYVMVYVGGQGALKTSSIVAMVPKALRSYVKVGLRLDLNNKDSIKAAVSAWVVELGEIDATFRRSDRALMKAFLSRLTDEQRLPYARSASNFLRRAIFIGTVNDSKFLHDKTGNRRFIPLTTTTMQPWADDEVDQLWAEAWERYTKGEQWWPTKDEDVLLFAKAEEHTETSDTEDLLSRKLDFEGAISGNVFCSSRRYGAAEVFNLIHNLPINHPVDPVRCRDTADALRRLWRLIHEPDREVVVRSSQSPARRMGRVYGAVGKNHGYVLPPRLEGQHFGDVDDAAADFSEPVKE